MTNITTIWLEFCKFCNKKHRVVLKDCPTCGVHQTPQPNSEIVLGNCNSDYSCDGCQAYREHQI